MDIDRHRFRLWLISVVLALVAVALYWPVTGYDFVNYDDPVYFSENPHVLAGLTWHSLPWAFQTTLDASWYPVSWLSFMLDAALFGPGPAGPHLMNVLLHAANGVLLFLLWKRLAGSLWRSALVAALFLVHPLHVESVAWVSERKDVLSGFFGLLALIAYARYAQGRERKSEDRNPRPEGNPKPEIRSPKPEARGRWSVVGGPWSVVRSPCSFSHLPASIFYLLSLCFFALGLMSKPMLVTWPFVMLLLDYWPLRRMQNAAAGDTHHAPRTTHHAPRLPPPASRLPPESQIVNRKSQILFPLFLEKVPFLLLAVVVSAVNVAVHKHAGAIVSLASIPISARVANAFVSYSRYLRQMCWPTDLAVPYLHPGHWPLGTVCLGVVLVAGCSAASLWLGRRRPYLLVGWFWFLGTLVPVIGLIQWGNQAMADRFLYVPSIGLFVALAWGLGELLGRWQMHLDSTTGPLSSNPKAEARKPKQAPTGEIQSPKRYPARWFWALPTWELGFVSDFGLRLSDFGGRRLAVLAGYARRWQPPKLAVASMAALVLFVLAFRSRDQLRYWRDSEALFRHALEVTQNNYFARNNLGAALAEKGQTEEAIRQFQEAIRLRPDEANAHHNLGNALLKKGQTDAAISQFQDAARLKPDSAPIHYNLGVALGNKGQTDAAISQFQEAIRLKPAYPEALGALASALDGQGKYAEAIRCYRAALNAQPDQEEVLNNLAWLLATCPEAAVRNGPEAVRLATRACELTAYAKPLLVGTLAAARAEDGEFPAAIATAERAATLADSLQQEPVAVRNRELLQLYRQGQPFHEKRETTTDRHR